MAKNEVEGLAELASNINKVVADKYPKQTEKFLKNEGNKLVRLMRKLSDSMVGEVTGNYKKGFKRGQQVYDWSDGTKNIRAYNKAPHAHLIEYGHRVVTRSGKDTGKFVPGKHVMETAIKQFEDKFASDVENNLVDFIVKELER